MVGDALRTFLFEKKRIINCCITLSINNGFCTSNYPGSQQRGQGLHYLKIYHICKYSYVIVSGGATVRPGWATREKHLKVGHYIALVSGCAVAHPVARPLATASNTNHECLG
jgi:hypothetical protein